MKADRVFGVGDRLGWRREQRKLGFRTFQHRAEFLAREIARTGHERQFGIDLGDEFEGRAALGACPQNIERGIGIAAQAVAGNAVDHALGDELRDDVQAPREQIGRRVGVICGDVILLRRRDMQPASRQEEELNHLDIGRQFTGAQRRGISEIGISTKQPLDDRRDEAPLQQIGRPRLFQRQRREEGETDGAVGNRARIKRVDDVIGFAEAERQADHEIGPDIGDDVLCNRLRTGK